MASLMVRFIRRHQFLRANKDLLFSYNANLSYQNSVLFEKNLCQGRCFFYCLMSRPSSRNVSQISSSTRNFSSVVNCLQERNILKTLLISHHRLQLRHMSLLSDVEVELGPLERYLDTLYEEYLQKQKDGSKKDENRIQFLKPLAELRTVLKQKYVELEDLNKLIRGLDPSDEEIRYMAEQERRQYHQQLEELKREIVQCIIPEESMDQTNVTLEVSPGIGGVEAMLFTKEVFEMYLKYAEFKGWTYEILEQNKKIDKSTDGHGLTKGTANINGKDVYKWLKYEGGVHRVQRKPVTDRNNKRQTSTITVAILPQPTEFDIVIDPKDLVITTKRASGAGGQHVNTTDSVVHIVHKPTGLTTECAEERSQMHNKKKALQKIRTMLYQKELEEIVSRETSQRKIQVGHAGRAEKIRTYNFHQNRITDHRIGRNLFEIDIFMSGTEMLDNLIKDLQMISNIEILQEILDNYKEKGDSFKKNKNKS